MSKNNDLWYTLNQDDVLNKFSSGESGLKDSQVDSLQKKYGFNELPKEKPLEWWSVLFGQFTSPLISILAVAAVISFALGEMVDAGVIAAAVLLNTIIGFVQEFKASRALEQLQSLVQPNALVLRAGKKIKVKAQELVPGDILILNTGDQVTADARLIQSQELKINEAALTGESMAVDKTIKPLDKGVVLADRTNMVYAGTSVVGGRAQAVVVATGINTQIGEIAKLVSTTEEVKTPLQEQLARLSKWIAILVGVITVGLFVLGVFMGHGLVEMFEMSVALAVAAIPEGLIVSMTIILAIGMQRILKRKSLVRRLVAAETLGSVSVICTDKTGTITEGEMRVTHFVTHDNTYEVSDIDDLSKYEIVKKIVLVSALCNDAQITSEKGKTEYLGNPTERALLQSVQDLNDSPDKVQKKYARKAEIPFDSKYKYMATVNEIGKGHEMLVKGASDRVVDFCSKVLISGKVKTLTNAQKNKIHKQVEELSSQGLRLLAFAYKPLKFSQKKIDASDMSDLVFLGLVGLSDPLRKEAKEQIEQARLAGVHTVVITGDHPKTASVIASAAGIKVTDKGVVTGVDLDGWTDKEFQKRVKNITVYARVEPKHKIRIVNAWQKEDAVVAMTGDGVNDAPALKAADIGIAVGSGTEVAKQASDLVLLDNNLGTITSAIEEGRVIFDNIRKSTVYLMADSFTEIVLIGGSLMMGLPIPLLPAQILWINLVADSFPNIGLTLEPGEKDVMKIPPRPRSEPVLNKDMISIIFIIGIVTDLILFVMYVWLLGEYESVESVRSIMFAAVGIDSLLYIFAVKSFRKTIFRINPFSNLWLIAGVLVGFALMLLALIHPFFQTIFEVTPLKPSDWGLLLMIGVLKLVAIEIAKEWFIVRDKKKSN